MNILINFRAGLGDFITLTPLLRALKSTGSHRLFFLGNTELKPLVEAYGYFSETIFINYRAKPFDKIQCLARAVQQWRGRIDWTITPLFQSGKFSSLVPILLASKKSVFYYRDGFSRFHKGNILPIHPAEPNVLQHLDLLKFFSIEPNARETEIPISEKHFQRTDFFLRDSGCDSAELKICLAPYVKGMEGYATKEWDFSNYHALALKLQKDLNARIIFLGSPKEISKIKNDIPDWKARRFLCQPADFDILEVAALLKRCDLLVCNDGGLMHVGVAANIPVVSIWGPTSPQRTGYPFKSNFIVVKKDDCQPCRYDQKVCWRDRQICLEIPVEQVFHSCLRVFSSLKGNLYEGRT